ncbi:hypothetical protein F511_18750 [Dorcoceras hygrometricum]|uniref:Uncharacterized protein n=1 Tax=Dorcoceras hygrometricum TaxID=472368 RepID=A0A2Z7ABT1_9LAMI|nr:hypothetical protein F511_18750 [Dorcoceras hygrometricum]
MTSALLMKKRSFSDSLMWTASLMWHPKWTSLLTWRHEWTASLTWSPARLLKYKLKVAEIYVEEAGGSNSDIIITITRAVGTITRAV